MNEELIMLVAHLAALQRALLLIITNPVPFQP